MTSSLKSFVKTFNWQEEARTQMITNLESMGFSAGLVPRPVRSASRPIAQSSGYSQQSQRSGSCYPPSLRAF